MRTSRKLKTTEFFYTNSEERQSQKQLQLKPKHITRSTVKYFKTIPVIFVPLSLSNIHTFQQDVQLFSLNGTVNMSPTPRHTVDVLYPGTAVYEGSWCANHPEDTRNTDPP